MNNQIPIADIYGVLDVNVGDQFEGKLLRELVEDIAYNERKSIKCLASSGTTRKYACVNDECQYMISASRTSPGENNLFTITKANKVHLPQCGRIQPPSGRQISLLPNFIEAVLAEQTGSMRNIVEKVLSADGVTIKNKKSVLYRAKDEVLKRNGPLGGSSRWLKQRGRKKKQETEIKFDEGSSSKKFGLVMYEQRSGLTAKPHTAPMTQLITNVADQSVSQHGYYIKPDIMQQGPIADFSTAQHGVDQLKQLTGSIDNSIAQHELIQGDNLSHRGHGHYTAAQHGLVHHTVAAPNNIHQYNQVLFAHQSPLATLFRGEDGGMVTY